MKKVLFFIFLCLSILSLISDKLISQVTTTPLNAKCGMDIFQASGTVSSNGIYYNSGTSATLFRVGRTYSVKERAVVQWDIPDNLIPDGSTVTSVTLTVYFSKITDDTQPYLSLINVGVDLENSPNPNDLWTKTDPVKVTDIGRTDGFSKQFNSIVGTFTSGSAFARAIEGSLPANKFTLGMAWMFEQNLQNLYREWLIGSNAYLTITYEPKKQSLTLDQKLSTGLSYGSIESFEGNVFQKYPVPKTFSFDVNSIQNIRADTNKATVADEKFNRWNYKDDDVINHKTVGIKDGMNLLIANFGQIGNATIKNALEGLSSVTGDTVKFQDPWLRDDNSDSKGLKNRGAGAIWHPYPSPFVQDITNPRFKGVLLNQPRSNINHYSVLAKPVFDYFLPQTGRTHRFYFQNWTSPNATITYPMVTETPVVFTANNSEVLANYKGTQLSSTQTAFSNSGQRKFIMTPQTGHPYGGDLHMVYESMGKIWYERSIDGGNTWVLENGGKPLNTDYVYDKATGQTTGTGGYTTAKHPSLDYVGNMVAVVFQEQYGANYLIRLSLLAEGIKKGTANDILFTSPGLYSEEAYPEIVLKNDLQAVVAIRRNDSVLRGLEVHYLILNTYDGTTSENCHAWITGTDQNTGAFTLATDKSSTDKFHIAWQQNGTSSSSVQYTKFNFIYETGEDYSEGNGSLEEPSAPGELAGLGGYTINPLETVNLSSATSYTSSFQPSMFAAGDGTARVAFKGYSQSYYGGGSYSVSLVNPDNTSWIPYLRKYTGEVFSPQISAGTETYFVGWTEPYNGYYRTVATDASTLRNMETVEGSLGRDIQINNGGSRFQQYSMGFNSESTSLPYTFKRSSAIGDIQAYKKTQALSGRGIYLNNAESQVYFILGNLTSGGEIINFTEAQDSVRLDGDLKKVNYFMTTEPFSLKENSTLSFAAICGTKDSLITSSIMKNGQFASFTLELIDDASGRVLGSYLNERIDKNNIFGIKESVFKVNSMGIVNRLIRLRVSVDENMKSHYTISEMLLGGGIPLSKAVKEMDLDGSSMVKEYSLSQNYPNPFNPTTLISYALPRASKVTLKVYDILGKEVATLVNDYREMGKYSVEFNASSLPSGTYIYEIRANDFVKSGKMMLIK